MGLFCIQSRIRTSDPTSVRLARQRKRWSAATAILPGAPFYEEASSSDGAFFLSKVAFEPPAQQAFDLRVSASAGAQRQQSFRARLGYGTTGNVSQVLTLDRALLTSKIRALPQRAIYNGWGKLRFCLLANGAGWKPCSASSNHSSVC
jgi:hypothetical protein